MGDHAAFELHKCNDPTPQVLLLSIAAIIGVILLHVVLRQCGINLAELIPRVVQFSQRNKTPTIRKRAPARINEWRETARTRAVGGNPAGPGGGRQGHVTMLPTLYHDNNGMQYTPQALARMRTMGDDAHIGGSGRTHRHERRRPAKHGQAVGGKPIAGRAPKKSGM